MDPGGYDDREPQYTYGIDEDEEEEEESDAEDLFAFLPPSTADQEQQHQEHTQTQAAAKYEPDYNDLFAATLPLHEGAITHPASTFDPHARYPADFTMGPSTSTPVSHYRSNLPVESPPSTDSQNPSDDPYRLRRVNGPPQTQSSTRASAMSSRGLDIDTSYEKTVHSGYGRRPSHGKHRSSTLADTISGVSYTPSMMENDSREGSVK